MKKRPVNDLQAAFLNSLKPQFFAQDFFGVIQNIGAGHGDNAVAYACGAVNAVVFNVQHQQNNHQNHINAQECQARLLQAFDKEVNPTEQEGQDVGLAKPFAPSQALEIGFFLFGVGDAVQIVHHMKFALPTLAHVQAVD